MIREVKTFTRKPVVVLTNSAHLKDAHVRRDLREADKVFCKLDTADDRTLRMVNRPVEGVTTRSLVEGIKSFRAEYPGYLAIQMMIMPMNRREIGRLADLLKEIGPDEAQLNTPLRPVPREWAVEARGNDPSLSCPVVRLRTIDHAEARSIEAELRRLTGLNIACAYRE